MSTMSSAAPAADSPPTQVPVVVKQEEEEQQPQQQQQQQPAEEEFAPAIKQEEEEPQPEDTNAEVNTIQRALELASTKLESARCLETELEAWTVFSASQLKHYNTSTSTSSNNNVIITIDNESNKLPMGVMDAWNAVAQAIPTNTEDGVNDNTTAAISNATTTTATTTIRTAGSLSQAIRTTCLAKSIQQVSELSTLTLTERMTEGPILKRTLEQLHQHKLANPNNYTDVWLQALDQKLQTIRQYHAQHQHHQHQTTTNTPWEVVGSTKKAKFSNPVTDGFDLAASVHQWTSDVVYNDATSIGGFRTEELFGKYLDLQPNYESILQHCPEIISADDENKINTKNYQYADFLEDLSKHCLSHKWKEDTKLQHRKHYVRWLQELQTYLEEFLQRTVPLLSVPKQVIQPAYDQFVQEWSETGGCSPGWRCKPVEARLAKIDNSTDTQPSQKEKEEATAHSTTPMTTSIDLSKYDMAQQLVDDSAIDADLLKAELAKLGMKCGGTPLQRAERLFLLKNCKSLDELPAKVFVNNKNNTSSNNNKEQQQRGTVTLGNDNDKKQNTNNSAKKERRVDIARREAIVSALLDQVRPTLELTIRRVIRRQTQTIREKEREVEEDLYGVGNDAKQHNQIKNNDDSDNDEDDDDDDSDAPIYNPKNVPLDWDGKPIPYWLFKLHGLNHYYPCEICGGESYRGRRSFELHFAEAKHALGMKSLGIPNTKHFHGVTKIQDAQTLWKSLCQSLEQEQFDATQQEEYEDSHGNVVSRAAYEDLARQGLL